MTKLQEEKYIKYQKEYYVNWGINGMKNLINTLESKLNTLEAESEKSWLVDKIQGYYKAIEAIETENDRLFLEANDVETMFWSPYLAYLRDISVPTYIISKSSYN